MKHPKGKKENNVEESSVSRQKVENVETVNKKKKTQNIYLIGVVYPTYPTYPILSDDTKCILRY